MALGKNQVEDALIVALLVTQIRWRLLNRCLLFGFAFVEDFLVASLHYIDEDEGDDHKVKRAFAHVLDMMPPKAELCEFATFGE